MWFAFLFPTKTAYATGEMTDSSVYLNNAASSWPKAPGVAEAMHAALTSPPIHPGRSVTAATDAIQSCRQGLAHLLGQVDPARVVLTMHATHALNLAIRGLRLDTQAGIVTTVTEHNSVLRPLHHLHAEYPRLRLSIVGLDASGAVDLQAWEQALSEGVELAVVNHVSNVTGRVNPVHMLLHRAHAAGATTLLDVSQSLGHLPIHAVELEADLIAWTGHKGVHGPQGTGGLYVAPGTELHQVMVGGTGVRSDLLLHPQDMPMRLEAGTPNVPAFAGLAAALRWLDEQGDEFRARERLRHEQLRHGLRHIPGVHIYDDGDAQSRLPVISFRISGWTVEEAGYVLDESFGIICRTGLHCAPLIHPAIGSAPSGTIRFSPSGFNSAADIDHALAAVRSLAQCAS